MDSTFWISRRNHSESDFQPRPAFFAVKGRNIGDFELRASVRLRNQRVEIEGIEPSAGFAWAMGLESHATRPDKT